MASPRALPPSGVAAPSRAARRPWTALRLTHPFPSLLNVAATAGLAFVAADGSPSPGVLVRMLLAMLFAQCAIGTVNDIFDRDLDATSKPWKPIPSGAVTLAAARTAAFVFIAAGIALAATLGWRSLLLFSLGTACGLAYDVSLKRTPFSALPFMVAIPTLPVWVWVTLDAWSPVLWWLWPLGALLGVSLHLANTLPDIDADAAHGVRGMAHRLGARGSMLAGWLSFAIALAASAILAPWLGYELIWYVPAALFGAACLVFSAALYAIRRDQSALQAGFGALGVGSAVVAVGWLAAAT